MIDLHFFMHAIRFDIYLINRFFQFEKIEKTNSILTLAEWSLSDDNDDDTWLLSDVLIELYAEVEWFSIELALLDDTEEDVNLEAGAVDFLLPSFMCGDSISLDDEDDDEDAVGEADVRLLESLDEQHSSMVVVVSMVVDSAPPLCDRFVSYSHMAVPVWWWWWWWWSGCWWCIGCWLLWCWCEIALLNDG